MKVILVKDVKSQGKKGDVIEVSDGYANNFLIKNKLAIPANTGNMNINARQKAEEARRIAEETAKAKADAEKLKSVGLDFDLEFGERGKAFGSISAKEIAEELAKLGYNIDKKNIHLEKPIKTEGVFSVEVKLYKGVNCNVKLNVRAK